MQIAIIVYIIMFVIMVGFILSMLQEKEIKYPNSLKKELKDLEK